MTPKISVIIPAYNAEKKISSAIKSVLVQTFAQWELIIVNDKSTDETLTVIKEFADKDSRIVILNKNVNERAFKARLDGVLKATSEWICFLDADDYLHKNALEKLFASVSSGSKIIIGSYCRTYDRFGFTRSKPINLLPDMVIEGEKYINDPKLDLSLAFYGKHSVPVSSCSRLINIKLFEQITNTEIPKIHSFDDTLLNLLLFEQIDKVFFIKDIIIDYRYGGGTSSVDDQTLQDLNELFKIRNYKIEEKFSAEKKKYSDIEYLNTIYYHYLNAIIINNWNLQKFKESLEKNSKLEIFSYLNGEYKKYSNNRFNMFFGSLENRLEPTYNSLLVEAKKVRFRRNIMRKIGSLLSKI